MSRLRRQLTLAVIVHLAACQQGSPPPGGAPSCAALSTCCSTPGFPLDQVTACAMAAGSGNELSCAPLLPAYVQAGWCPASIVADGGLPDLTTGPDVPAGNQAPACDRFIACTQAVAPDQAAGAMAAYGPDGACWTTESRESCVAGCQGGLDGLHALHPDVPACALCQGDADCGGATPACDPASGACVQCTGSQHCPEACDPATLTCVECTTSADCGGATPACDPDDHRCVECTAGADCDSGRCEPDRTCCQPDTACHGQCGTVSDGCGRAMDCGTCRVGTCQSNRCTSQGMPCPMGSGGSACADNEWCMFEVQAQTYRCNSTSTAPTDLSVSQNASRCDGDLGQTYCHSIDGDYFICSSLDSPDSFSHCVQVCLVSADCIARVPCLPYFDRTEISPSKPGYCKYPP